MKHLSDDLREGLSVLDVDVRDAGLHRIIDLEEYSGPSACIGLGSRTGRTGAYRRDVAAKFEARDTGN